MRNVITRLLKEAMQNSESLPESTGLFVSKNGDGFTFNLFEPNSERIYATLTAFYDKSKSDFYYVGVVAADKGYGPLIYELAMQFLYTKGEYLTSARDANTTSSAWRVWEKFYKRGDVNKSEIPLENSKFSFAILIGDEQFDNRKERQEFIDDSTPEELEALKIANTGFNMNPDENFRKLLSIGSQSSDDTKDRAKKSGETLWDLKY